MPLVKSAVLPLHWHCTLISDRASREGELCFYYILWKCKSNKHGGRAKIYLGISFIINNLKTKHIMYIKYSKTCLNRTPYIPETWTNGK